MGFWVCCCGGGWEFFFSFLSDILCMFHSRNSQEEKEKTKAHPPKHYSFYKEEICNPLLILVKLPGHCRCTASCGLLQNKRILNCESFSATYLCNLWDVWHLKLPTTLIINWRMQPITLSPMTVSKVTNKDTDMGCMQCRNAQKHCYIATSFNTLDCILQNAKNPLNYYWQNQ